MTNTVHDEVSELWDVHQVCAYLRVKPGTWRRYQHEGRGPEPVGAVIGDDGRSRKVWSAKAVRDWHESRSRLSPDLG